MASTAKALSPPTAESPLAHHSLLGIDDSELQQRCEALRAELVKTRRARDDADDANRIKNSFLQSVSHELKDPITAILLQQQLLLSDPYVLQAPPVVARGFAGIARSVSRLVHLVDTALGWTRVESGGNDHAGTALDLDQLVSRAAAECRPQADAKHVSLALSLSGPAPISSDPYLLRLIVINLIERAISAAVLPTISIELDHTLAEDCLRITHAGPAWYGKAGHETFSPSAQRHDVDLCVGVGLFVLRDLARAIGAFIQVREPDASHCEVELKVPRELPTRIEPSETCDVRHDNW